MQRPLDRISDDELSGRLNAVRAMIRRTRKHGGDTQDAEVELCYLEREVEIRESRKMAHQKYLADVQSQFINEQEEEEALRDYLENGGDAVLL